MTTATAPGAEALEASLPTERTVRVRSDSVLQPIHDLIGTRRPEHSGILGMDTATQVITHFHYDAGAEHTAVSNTSNVVDLNSVVNDVWDPHGIRYVGSVHSHPPGCRQPSAGDVAYGEQILKAKRSLPELHMWIVMPHVDRQEYELLTYVLTRDSQLRPIEILQVGKDHPVTDKIPTTASPEQHSEPAIQAGVTRIPLPDDELVRSRHSEWQDIGRQWARVHGAYAAGRLVRSRLICIGTGGIRATLVDCARTGIEEFVLIDPDTISESNVATQNVYRDEIGQPKVEAVKRDILRINPNARVIAVQAPVNRITDQQLACLIHDPMIALPWPGRGTNVWVDLRPEITVSVAGTDSFEAQARNNRIGLHWGIPTLNSQVYERGLGAEVTFTHPDTTPACHRCVLCRRYHAYLHEDFHNPVGSSGSPICATQRLGALEGFVLMALLHHGTGHPRFGGLLQSIGPRNLVQIRMAPDLSSQLGLRVFDRIQCRHDRVELLFDDTVWISQEPEDGQGGRPVCPECGGTGDLRDSEYRFEDTRHMPL